MRNDRTKPPNAFLACVVMAPLIVVAVGCGGEPRGDVSGTVTFDGQPVAQGMVSFESTKMTGPPRNVPIRDGQYQASGATGLAPGTYRVRISADDVAAMGITPETDQHAPFNYVPLLPSAWNVQSELSVEVRDGGNTFNFSGKKGEQPQVDIP
jgi:hypothetical protein